jgi:SAM-dependent methyltransferase
MPFKGKNILELGGKNASLSLWAAEKGGLVTCSDIVGFENQYSQKVNPIEKGSIRFEIIDALDIGLKETYDFILFKSMLGGIGRIGSEKLQMDVMRQVHKSLRKGGEVLFIENMRGAFIHQMYRKKYGATRNGWCYPSLSDFIKMSKIFSKVKYETFGVLGSSGNLLIKVRKSFDFKFEKTFPKSWRYIFAGIYQK